MKATVSETIALLALSTLSLGAHCECPDEAVVPASYAVEAGQFAVEGVALTFADCVIQGESGPFFSTDEIPTTLGIECGTPVLEPGEPLFRLTVPLGDIRDRADQVIDLSELNLIAEWSADGIPVGPSRVPEGGVATVQTLERRGARASYPENVTDDFDLKIAVEIAVPAFTGQGGDPFPGATMELTIAQSAADYRRDPGPDPDCL